MKLNKIEKTSKIVTGKQIQVSEKTLIPIIKITNLSRRQGIDVTPEKPDFIGFHITPLALVLVDQHGEWVLPVQEEKITLSSLKEKIPDLEEKIMHARAQSFKTNK
jgi:uncharacterized spore protein YtfJ